MRDLRPAIIGDEEHEDRMRAARARAEWELGDASWAAVIVGAYLHPAFDAEALDAEREGD